MKPLVTWVLLIDKQHARILESKGSGTGLVQLPGHAFDAPELNSYSDDEGRTLVSHTKARARMEKHVEHSPESVDFARNMASYLEKARRKGAFDRLVISAAPSMLGILRNCWSNEVKATVKAELDKELVRVPIDKLYGHFDDILSL